MARLEGRLAEDSAASEQMRLAHERYATTRWALLTDQDRATVEARNWTRALGKGVGIAGIRNPASIKCLHTQLAFWLALGGVNGEATAVGGGVSAGSAGSAGGDAGGGVDGGGGGAAAGGGSVNPSVVGTWIHELLVKLAQDEEPETQRAEAESADGGRSSAGRHAKKRGSATTAASQTGPEDAEGELEERGEGGGENSGAAEEASGGAPSKRASKRQRRAPEAAPRGGV